MTFVMTIADTPIGTTLLALGGVLACLGIMAIALHMFIASRKERKDRRRRAYHIACERQRVQEIRKRWHV